MRPSSLSASQQAAMAKRGRARSGVSNRAGAGGNARESGDWGSFTPIRPTIISVTRSLWRYEKIGTRRRSHGSHHKALLVLQSAGSARGGLHLSRRTARRALRRRAADISYREHYQLFVRECNQPHAVLEPPHESVACDHRATAPTIRQGRRSDYL